ncbi:MAG: O-antigen ligase family protein [Patescibacteria group bacterium]
MAALALAIAFAFGNLYKFSFFSPEVRISALDIAVFSLTILALPLNLKKYRSLAVPIAAFFTVSLISLVLALPTYGWPAIFVGSMYLVRWVVFSLFFASIIQLIKPVKIAYIIYSLGLLTVVISLGQYLIFPDIRSLVVSEWDPHYYRAVGQFLDPGFTGILLVFTLIFLTLNPFKNHLINLITWSASYLAFALTYSRSSYAAFLVSMAYIAWKIKGWKFFMGILLLFGVTLAILPRAPDGEGVKLERTSSIQARIDSWTTAWRIFTQHPILGVGFNVYRYAQGASLKSHAGAGADSSLLFVAATTGLVGLLVYLWYLRRLYLLSTMNHELRTTLVGLLVHSLFLNSLFYPAVMVWIALLLSVSGSLPGPLPPAPISSRRDSN